MGCLAQHEEPVVNLDKLTYAGNIKSLASLLGNPKHIFIKGDIRDTVLVTHLLMQYQPRAVINFAAESHFNMSIHGPGEFIQTNIVATFNLLESVRGYWTGMPQENRDGVVAPTKSGFRFLHVSTDEVYGSLKKDDPAFTEISHIEPTAYSARKEASDHLVRAWHHTYVLPVLTTNSSNN